MHLLCTSHALAEGQSRAFSVDGLELFARVAAREVAPDDLEQTVRHAATIAPW